MLNRRIVIIGAGVAGLYAAARLLERGHREVVLLEARQRIGGRLLSLPEGDHGNRYDLGATWYWPGMQHELHELVSRLGLITTGQHEAGDMLVERSIGRAPDRFSGFISAPSSLRLEGGMVALAEALARRIPDECLWLEHRVTRIATDGKTVDVHAVRGDGASVSWQAAHVLLALPPRLAAATLDLVPALPASVMRQWRSTGTWMAPHAKYVAVYDEPFWREQGLSGHARSNTGPLVEIHDASPRDGSGALFGFIGIPATMRRRLSDEDLRMQCRAELARLFGEQAAKPRAEYLKDWACDALTATEDDQMATGHHEPAVSISRVDAPWHAVMAGIASEWSPSMPGYIAGAIEAADHGVDVALAGIPIAGMNP
ncbi:FAD-dependent oxidoreductase [Luteibacter anthropi]|uniref:flavin monoamine oxidase family protein n=1 Tax=Luteibacter anthropi TaxID=564369 RepID=UPI002032E2C9|nr:FAD-dependent oxidoreductase [Luteibacter anthropi]URX63704.1 FAD-dependent oxidoreductase [Luteibacter anthropi]